MTLHDEQRTPRRRAPGAGRPRDESRRADLLERAAAVLIARESSEVSLRTLADELGESPRMLVHHFGSRDALITAALTGARQQLLERVSGQLDARAPEDLPGLVAAVREVILAPSNRSLFRLFDEVNAISQTQPARFPGFGSASVHDWLPQFQRLLGATLGDPDEARAQATLALGVVRGLMLDLNATGDSERIAGAFAALERLACRQTSVQPAQADLG